MDKNLLFMYLPGVLGLLLLFVGAAVFGSGKRNESKRKTGKTLTLIGILLILFAIAAFVFVMPHTGTQ